MYTRRYLTETISKYLVSIYCQNATVRMINFKISIFDG